MSGFYYIKIANGLLEPKHVESMGEAVWLYMWLQDKNTSVNENGEGRVLGGRPVVYEDDVKPALGVSRPTYTRWVDKLRDAGYIKTLRTPRGLVIVISKAKKYKGSIKNEHHQRSKSDVPKTDIPSDVSKTDRDVSKSKRDASKSNIQYKTTQHYTKTIQTTNVVAAPDKPARAGNADINEMFDYWATECQFNIESRVKANRFACSNLLKKHGKDKLMQFIRGAAMAQNEQYAPNIADFCALQSKLGDLVVWGRRRYGNSSLEVIS